MRDSRPAASLAYLSDSLGAVESNSSAQALAYKLLLDSWNQIMPVYDFENVYSCDFVGDQPLRFVTKSPTGNFLHIPAEELKVDLSDFGRILCVNPITSEILFQTNGKISWCSNPQEVA